LPAAPATALRLREDASDSGADKSALTNQLLILCIPEGNPSDPNEFLENCKQANMNIDNAE
jgi:hypothetical protein